ncbi:sigma-54-dependent transcriptional regulator [Aquimarina spongiae]|uniref:DNA-binding transcriptional response regulator, NtrC family, contains REC, AAA-type ATPase, and a Fis-type DNA-binding domains n=1 Tax=Aquimarina spongiae TaxID=570521 RepID=A0A1M6H143_9FLAO|nr:sigma-54 dependent transcriptional regulator [Aquimarina spongiae]SHJ15918.1 DNA-binding transcriptional response regulator, NtrC family, contains REC, AAA-type ATPase, and a Fis-type DNA-binding domains [Aquimarina spongiae]
MTTVTQKKGKILIVDDNEDILKAANIFLKRHFEKIDLTDNPESIPYYLNRESYDLILLDMNFTRDVSSGKEGFDWLERILHIDPNAVVVLMTAYGDIQTAVKAIKAGATNFVLKPWENNSFLATLYSSIQLRESKLEIENLRSKQQELNTYVNNKYKEIIGQSPAIQKVFYLIDRVASTDANVLILGENGTGKELIANAIHRNSLRNREPFVGVDLGSISESLFESELFGHKKGAFTDAKEDRAGRFEVASGGTLFLDEIGNLSLALQAKLLTSLQSRKINRVGSNKLLNVDIRLICATNLPLYEMVEEQTFRQDLLYRINTIEIHLPPLRERLEDIPLLANHFLKIYSRKYNKKNLSISKKAISNLQQHSWPGNIRELQHSIERAVIMSSEIILQPHDFDIYLKPNSNQNSTEHQKLEDVEKTLIQKTLLKYEGNITKTANELGITRPALYRRLKKHGL